jgi:hypothetical protein
VVSVEGTPDKNDRAALDYIEVIPTDQGEATNR